MLPLKDIKTKMEKLQIDETAKENTDKVSISNKLTSKSFSSEFGGMRKGFLIGGSSKPKAQDTSQSKLQSTDVANLDFMAPTIDPDDEREIVTVGSCEIVDSSNESKKKTTFKLHEDKIDPLKLFVDALRNNLNQDQLLDKIKVLKNCNNLKNFSAEKCINLNEKIFNELLLALPCLVKINVSQTAIKGYCFNMLPEGLKELNISSCRKISRENLLQISKVCKDLEVLDIKGLDADKGILEELGVNCTHLRSLKFSCAGDEVSNQIKVFTKLKSLKIVASSFELNNIVDHLKDLEKLHIQVMKQTVNIVDFSKFNRLRNVVISGPFRKNELMSLGICQNLQFVTIMRCNAVDQKCIRNIVKGCLEVKIIGCRTVGFDIRFMNDINEIMRNRSTKIDILGKRGAMTCNEFTNYYWDSKKVNFDFDPNSFFEEDFMSNFNDDLFDEKYDSDGSFDHRDNFGQYEMRGNSRRNENDTVNDTDFGKLRQGHALPFTEALNNMPKGHRDALKKHFKNI